MQKIIAANWKMYKTREQARDCAQELVLALGNTVPQGRRVLFFPPFTAIAEVTACFAGLRDTAVGGQNFFPGKEGAFTGEISADMLCDAGATWVLVGHSERRHIFGESDALVANKAGYALSHGLNLMLCIGETLEEREAGRLEAVLERQLASAMESVFSACADKEYMGRLAVAYEPVWAIGTGRLAGQSEVLEAHAAVRGLLTRLVGNKEGMDIPILYGGSVKPDNAGTLLELDNVNGLLVGGASLEAKSFLQIIGA